MCELAVRAAGIAGQILAVQALAGATQRATSSDVRLSNARARVTSAHLPLPVVSLRTAEAQQTSFAGWRRFVAHAVEPCPEFPDTHRRTHVLFRLEDPPDQFGVFKYAAADLIGVWARRLRIRIVMFWLGSGNRVRRLMIDVVH